MSGAFWDETEPTADGWCTWKLLAGSRIGSACPACGHSDLGHVGTKHCPVCELVWQASPQGRRKLMRIAGIPASAVY